MEKEIIIDQKLSPEDELFDEKESKKFFEQQKEKEFDFNEDQSFFDILNKIEMEEDYASFF